MHRKTCWSGCHPEEEFGRTCPKVTGGLTNEHLARLVIRRSSTCRDWMRSHGVHFQPALAGALHGAHQRVLHGRRQGAGEPITAAPRRWAQIARESPVDRIEIETAASRPRTTNGASASPPKAACWPPAALSPTANGCASSGPERARRVARRQLLIRGTALQPRRAAQAPARRPRRRPHWRPHAGAHGGHRRTRAAVRRRHLHAHRLRVAGRGGIQPQWRTFYDEGEDFWPKRVTPSGAAWLCSSRGRLVIPDHRQQGHWPAYAACVPGVGPTHCPSWRKAGLPVDTFTRTLTAYNRPPWAGSHRAGRLPH